MASCVGSGFRIHSFQPVGERCSRAAVIPISCRDKFSRGFLGSRLQLASTFSQRRPALRVECRDRWDRNVSRNRRSKRDEELSNAMKVLSREWPSFILPAVGLLTVATFIGPLVIGAAFTAFSIAAVAATLAAPIVLMTGAGLAFAGFGVAATVGFIGLSVVPTLFSLAAMGMGAFLGARLVKQLVSSGRGEAEGEDRVMDVTEQAFGEAVQPDEDQEYQRKLKDELKTFDEMLRLKEKMRRGD